MGGDNKHEVSLYCQLSDLDLQIQSKTNVFIFIIPKCNNKIYYRNESGSSIISKLKIFTMQILRVKTNNSCLCILQIKLSLKNYQNKEKLHVSIDYDYSI